LKVGQTALLIGAGVIAYSLLRKAGGAALLSFQPGKIANIEWEGVNPVLNIGLMVQNTSNQSYTLNSFAGDVFADNYFIGNISSFTVQTVAPNSQSTLFLKIKLQLTGIATEIIRAVTNKNFTKTLALKATANVDNLQIPVVLNYKIGL